MDKCDICGGDKDVGKLAKRLGHRPDVAWAEANKMHRKYASLEDDLRKIVKEARREASNSDNPEQAHSIINKFAKLLERGE